MLDTLLVPHAPSLPPDAFVLSDEEVIQRLWLEPGSGGAAELSAVQSRFSSGRTTVRAALLEGASLAVEGRASLLSWFAARVTKDADAGLLTAAALSSGPYGTRLELTQHRDFAVALAANRRIGVDAVLAAAEPLNGERVGFWNAKVAELRSHVVLALLERDGRLASLLVRELSRIATAGQEPIDATLRVAEALLEGNASLAQVIDHFPGAVKSRSTLFNSPRMLGDLLARHAGRATGADAQAIAVAIGFLGDFPLEQRIIRAMVRGAASAEHVLAAIAASATTVKPPGAPFRTKLQGVLHEKVDLAVALLGRKELTEGQRLTIQQFASDVR